MDVNACEPIPAAVIVSPEIITDATYTSVPDPESLPPIKRIQSFQPVEISSLHRIPSAIDTPPSNRHTNRVYLLQFGDIPVADFLEVSFPVHSNSWWKKLGLLPFN